MSRNPPEKANFAEQFKDYNQTSSQLQMLDKLFDTDDFKSSASDDTKIALLSMYLENLKFKMYIDAEVFSRKEESKKNFQSFEKRFIQLNELKKNLNLSTPEEYRIHIEKEYQHYFEEITSPTLSIDTLCKKSKKKIKKAKSADPTIKLKLIYQATKLSFEASEQVEQSLGTEIEKIELACKKIKLSLEDLEDNSDNQQLIKKINEKLAKIAENLQKHPTKKANKLSYLKDANDIEYTNWLKDRLVMFNNDIRAPSARIFNPLISTVMAQFIVVPNNLTEVSNFINILSPYLSYGIGFTIAISELLKSGKHVFDDHVFYKDKQIDTWDKFKVQVGLRSDSIFDILGAMVIMLSNNYLNNLHGQVQSDWGAGLMTGFLILDFIYNEYKIAHEKLKLEALKKELHSVIKDEKERSMVIGLLDNQQEKKDRLNWGMRIYLFLWYTSIGINMFSKVADVVLASSIASLIIQILFSLKDTYLKLATITDEKEWYRELEKSGLRIFVQILIPSLLICYGLFLAPTLPGTLPAFFVLAAFITVSALCVRLVNRWNEYSDAKWALEDYNKEKIDKHLDHIKDPEEKKREDNLKIASQNFYYQSGYTLAGIVLVGAIAASIVTAGAAAPIILASICLVILIKLLRDDIKRNNNLNEVLDDNEGDENDETQHLTNH